MRSFLLFQRTAALYTQHLSQSTSRTYTTLLRQHRQSPFLTLFARHASRPSIRHLLSPRSRPFSTKPKQDYNRTPNLNSPQPSLSLSQRLRKLSREYGWSAFGVYMTLSALDFPFCFLAVRWLGTERIGQWEHAIVEWVKRAVPVQIPESWRGKVEEEVEEVVVETVGGIPAGYDHGVREAEKENSGDNASIWTQLALAYAIHKSFIFIRVPITAAITPKVVKTLRGWGWNIGKRRPKSERLAAKT